MTTEPRMLPGDLWVRLLSHLHCQYPKKFDLIAEPIDLRIFPKCLEIA